MLTMEASLASNTESRKDRKSGVGSPKFEEGQQNSTIPLYVTSPVERTGEVNKVGKTGSPKTVEEPPNTTIPIYVTSPVEREGEVNKVGKS